ncbi:MAG: M1 family metallopeptidase [Ginsengibacter sp.]
MKKLFYVLLIFLQRSTANGQQATAALQYFQQQVNYKINVTLNDVNNSLDGFINIDYTNNSPDTLHYIWFHLWPNAFKNDKTAFSDQLLENGRTDFYFSDNEKKGYINRLNFKVNGLTARLDDHPQYIDIAKLVLPLALIPGQTINISSPFHVKLPYNFSRGGYVDHTYQVTQWYPKPAVYDARGWHAMPYLDQGEFYSEFGNFDVQITLPKDYIVAATGDLQTEEEKQWLVKKTKEVFNPPVKENNKSAHQIPKRPAAKKLPAKKSSVKKSNTVKKPLPKTIKGKLPNPTSFPGIANETKVQNTETKTLNYVQNNVHDFAWFADKNFLVRIDTLQLPSGRIISAQAFFTPQGYSIWKNGIQFIKDAVITRSEWLGEYPYNVVTALEAKMGFSGGMEYPTITSISPMPDEKDLDLVIEHEVGHNWNYGIMGNNERTHPWMDEGMNTFFDNRYLRKKYPKSSSAEFKTGVAFIDKRIPADVIDLAYRTQVSIKKDQPIETTSEKFSKLNYGVIGYYKTGLWLKVIEDYIGRELFDSCLHVYFNRWKFKHPYPEDFKNIVQELSGKNVDPVFSLLNKKGIVGSETKKTLQLKPLFNFRETDKYKYIFITPAAGINYYDKLMIGGLVHNYTLPANHLQFFAAPMYGVQSKKFTGLARVAYNWSSYNVIQKGEFSVNAATFTIDDFTDSAGNVKYLGFNKIVPSLKIVFREKNDRSSVTKWLQWKTFFIQEQGLSFTRDTVKQIDIITYPKSSRYLNQLKFVIENDRVLYPGKGELLAEQGEGFVRTTFNGNYFFNYKKEGGLDVRLFAGKFFYLGDKTFTKQFATDRYHLNMTGANGYEDYTYSNYFIGRNEFKGASSQQIMIRDGGFKVRTDLLAAKIGRTDDWLAALNFKTSIPKNINPLEVFPIKIPVKAFFDIGTYAEAWDKNSPNGKFLYDAGFQVSFLHDLINIYIPVAYSKVYSDYFKSTITEKRFLKNISFSIDIQNFNLKNILPQFPF